MNKKQWWKDKTPHELSLRGAYAAQKRWDNSTEEQKKAVNKRLNEARWPKDRKTKQ